MDVCGWARWVEAYLLEKAVEAVAYEAEARWRETDDPVKEEEDRQRAVQNEWDKDGLGDWAV